MIPVYQAEIDAGIAELVKASASVAYCTQLEPLAPTHEFFERVLASKGAKAGLSDTDLYPVKSVLVSTNKNLNDDVFDRYEVWAARLTPIHKPDNLNHDETKIVGHMVDCWGMDEDGKVIANDIALDNLPLYFHLVNNSVIYKSWSTEEMKKSVGELIEKIEAGEKFVSMECLFRGFDYSMASDDGTSKVVARNAETAFLTKHLRIYGGTGKYDGYSVARVLRNITFVGKGYVDKPANPESVIFSAANTSKLLPQKEIITVFEKNGVLIPCKANLTDLKENSDMSDTNKVLEDQVAELKAQVKALTEKNETLATSASKASLDEAKKEVESLSVKLAASETSLTAAKSEVDTLKADKTKAEEALKAANEAKATVETELQKLQTENTKARRVNTLVAGGIAEDAAIATVDKFVTLSDEQFAEIADLAIKAAKAAFPPKEDEKMKKGKEKKADCKAGAELDEAEEESEAALGGTSGESEETDGAEELRKSMASQFESFIGLGSK